MWFNLINSSNFNANVIQHKSIKIKLGKDLVSSFIYLFIFRESV